MIHKNKLQITAFGRFLIPVFLKASFGPLQKGLRTLHALWSRDSDNSQKVFSFGHPDVNTLVDRFLSRSHSSNTSAFRHALEAWPQRSSDVKELNVQLTHVTNVLEEEEKRGESLDQIRVTYEGNYWWAAPINKLKLHELELLCVAIEELKNNVTDQVSKILMETTIATSLGVGTVDHFVAKPLHIVGTSSSVPSCYNADYVQGCGIF